MEAKRLRKAANPWKRINSDTLHTNVNDLLEENALEAARAELGDAALTRLVALRDGEGTRLAGDHGVVPADEVVPGGAVSEGR